MSGRTCPPLVQETRSHVETECAALYLNRKPQTRRVWASSPWKFWGIRDIPTIVEAAAEMGFDKRSVQLEGTAHNPLDEAVHQARVIAHSWATCVPPAAREKR
jgi:hypothetical protein